MSISKLSSDNDVLAELGRRLSRRRLDLQITQADLARQAGVSKRTVERIEAGASAQMVSIIRICRVLDLMAGLDGLAPPAGPRPMDLIRLKGRQRQRASSGGKAGTTAGKWTWGE
jgi:transcriptional regulator with XRE-family HTH domain